MHRHLSRAARRSIADSKNVPKDQTRVRRNSTESRQSPQTFSSFQDQYYFRWRPQIGTRYAQFQIVNALRVGARERALKMLLNLGNANGSLGPDDFSFVLDYCAKTPDPLFAVSQEKLSAVHDISKDCTKYYSPSIITLRKFILSFTRLNALESAYAVLEHMVALATRESASLRTSSKSRYQSSRLDIPIPSCSELPHKIVGSKGVACSSNILLEGTMGTEYSLERSFMDQVNMEKQSLHIVEEDLLLGRFNLDPSHIPSTVRNIICNEAERDKINSNIFSSAEDISGNDYQNLEQTEFAEMNLQNIKQQGLGFGVLKARISPPVKRILRWSFNNVIHASARTKNYKLAEHLFMQMHDLGLEPSGDTYDGLVKAVVYEKGVNYGMKVIEYMEKRNIKPYNDTLAVLSTGHSKNLELDLAEDLLEAISDGLPKYIHPFNAILSACDAMSQSKFILVYPISPINECLDS